MKKILAVVLALVLCLALCAVGSAEGKYKIGILAPAVTHGWLRASLTTPSRNALLWRTKWTTSSIPPTTRRK